MQPYCHESGCGQDRFGGLITFALPLWSQYSQIQSQELADGGSGGGQPLRRCDMRHIRHHQVGRSIARKLWEWLNQCCVASSRIWWNCTSTVLEFRMHDKYCRGPMAQSVVLTHTGALRIWATLWGFGILSMSSIVKELALRCGSC